MNTLRVIGIDPGPVPGFVVLGYDDSALVRTEALQCGAGLAPALFRTVLADRPVRTIAQIEMFVVSHRAGRSSTASAGAETRDLIAELRQVWGDFDSTSSGRRGGLWFERRATDVKPWATDVRLRAAGLLDATKGMRHARDAARHALFVAVRDGGIPDPLSRKATR